MSGSTEQESDVGQATSSGHNLAEGAYLDRHFECMRTEYEAMLRSTNIQPGWRVLDAGAGGGSFLPLIDALVGSNGQIDALDLAPENVQRIQQRIDLGQFSSSVVARAGSVIDLPYDDNVFDLVWCANVSQYLNDDELTSMLQEMHRVTRPGGFVALKEVDATKNHVFGPLDPSLRWHFLEVARHIQQTAGVLRTTYLPRWFRNTGFDSINYRSFVAERRQPLEPVAIEFLQDIGAFIGNRAVELGLPEDELVHWRRLIDPEAPNYILKDPDFYFCEVSAVVMGQVPQTVSV